MKTIYKYKLEPVSMQKLEIPLLLNNCIHDFKEQVLKIDVLNNTPCLWVMVDNNNRSVTRTIYIKGTGHDCLEVDATDYIDSFILHDDNLVFHVFGY